MLFYSITFIVFLIGALKIEKSSLIEKKIWYFLEWLLLVLIAGFRYKIGGDTYYYMQKFQYLPTFDQLENFDFIEAENQPLWYVLNALCKSICDDFYFFQFLHAVIVNSLIFIFFKEHTSKYFKAVLIYFIFFFLFYNTEILRASISISIFLFGYKYLLKKKWLKYYICSLIAVGFHTQALILFIFPLYHLIERKSIKTDIYAFIIILVAFSSTTLFFDLSSFLSFSEFTQERVLGYMQQEKLEANFFGMLSNILKLLFVFLIYLMLPNENKRRPFFIYFGIGCTLLTFKYSVVFGRIQDFVNPIFVLYIILILKKRTFLSYLLLICMFWSWGNIYIWKVDGIRSYHKYFPYATWLSPEEDEIRTKVSYGSH